MIAPPQALPFVVWRNNRLVPLSELWLMDSIESGAMRAGYSEWDLAPHIAKAIAVYLEEEFDRTTITVPQLQEMMTQSIERIGFRDVAQATSLISPKVSISLLEVARRSSYELLFFPLLREKIQDALAYEARGLIFEELRPCVKILHQAPRWKQNCEDLSVQIIDYIRCYMTQCQSENLDLVIV